MTTSAEVALLYKVSELARRYGMRPSEADASLDMVFRDASDDGHFELTLTGESAERSENFQRLADALGCNIDGVMVAESMSDLEDAVDRVLAIAPRARNR